MVIVSKLNRPITFLLNFNSRFNAAYCTLTASALSYSSVDGDRSTSDQYISRSSSNDPVKRIPLTIEDFKNIRKVQPSQPNDPHLLRVAMLGEPNAGKSTLTNSLVKWRVCSVSKKVHTTRKQASAVLVEDNKQIVFIDLPGYVSPELTKRHHLESSFVMDPVKSIYIADIIAVIVDITNKWTNNRLPENILEILETYKDKKSILVLNKVDAMKSKDRLLSLTRILTSKISDGGKTKDSSTLNRKKYFSHTYDKFGEKVDGFYDLESLSETSSKGWTSFSKIFMVSGLKNDGVDELRNYLISQAKPHKWVFPDNVVTDQDPHEIAIMTVREKLLEYLPEEIPYLLEFKIAKWEILSSGCPKIDITIKCANSRHKRFVIGPGGKHITACAERSRRSLMEAFRTDVVLHLGVI